ncbi:helix-turn-helix domain-containing protein [Desulfobacula sp.]
MGLNSEKDWQNPVIIQAKVTQEHLASLIGSSQQTISENLTLFKNKNLIQIKQKRITILNPLKLLKLAEM